MATELGKVGDLPEKFMRDVLMRAFSNYSVALGFKKDTTLCRIGSGVLVQKGKRFGILTAHHCLHACSPEVKLGTQEGTTLWLCLERGRAILVDPVEAVEHVLAKPESEEFGPDLTFIEILSIDRLDSFKAVGSFWSLDRSASQVTHEFGTVGTPVGSIGFPDFHYNRGQDNKVIRHQIRHMIYANAIQEGDVFEKNGWDYLESNIHYPGSIGLPPSFAGLSGGPVWAMEIIHKKKTDEWSIGKFALVGITFYQTALQNEERRLRAHFINSIYDLAWRGLT